MSSVLKRSVIGSALSRILEDDLLFTGSVAIIVDIYVAILADTDVLYPQRHNFKWKHALNFGTVLKSARVHPITCCQITPKVTVSPSLYIQLTVKW
jgi:uncharacterized membrane protein (DUF441 family)